ncbi:hypothetical protein EGI31_12685 [Lacihabitans soyangensis]|uniref:Uncharacterized protein n=2 Tax=Lacihabitans soyangensis TaxID=869394 RepID=A0AAE3H4A6_9BACT|nr:hypothetical protein [Lacihabitans soyangensis]
MLVVMMVFVGLLATIDVTAQRVRTTAVFDGDTATRPKAGFYGVGVRSGRVFLVKPTGNTERILAASTHVGVNGQFLFSNGTVNSWANIAISNVTSLQSSLDGKFNTPSGLTTNYLSKWTGSTFGNSLIFDNGTSLGIGTTSSTRRFEIAAPGGSAFFRLNAISSGTGNVFQEFTNSGGTAYIGIDNSTGTGFAGGNYASIFGSGAANPTVLITAGTPKLTILSGGNVGIGTTSPQQKTHINTSLGGVPVGLYLTNDATNATLGRGVGVLFGGTGNTNLAQIEAQTLTASNNTGGLIFRTANGGTLTEQMRIDQNGNVGIARTPSGSYKLAISGRILANDLFMTNPSTLLNVGYIGNISTWTSGSANDNFAIGTPQSYMAFYVNNSTAESMRINSGGLAIGTTSPDASAQLHVSSTTKGVLITRGTTTQINAITSPANGLMVYNTTLNKLCVYENGAWRQVTTTAM